MTRRMNAKKISKSILALLMAVPALFTTNVMAQELKKPTLEDLIPGGETYHTAENKWYQWWGDAACLELGIDNIEGTWAVKGLGAKPERNSLPSHWKKPTRCWKKKDLENCVTFMLQRLSTYPEASIWVFKSK